MSAGRIAAYNADPDGRDWGVSVLYLRAKHGHLFEGAANNNVRRQAKTGAEADINVRVKEVAAGGKVLGTKVREMIAGKLAVSVVVSGVVYGKVVGAIIEHLGGGTEKVDMDIGTVGKGSVVIGTKIDKLG